MATEITVRIVHRTLPAALLYEVDGTEVSSLTVEGEPDAALKIAELGLRAAGWEPDLGGMYSDMSLTVLKFHPAPGS